MKATIIISIILLVLLSTATAGIDYKLEGSINAGSTGNILKDSSETTDTYSTYNGTARLYFLPQLELNFFGEYTYYSQLYDLSNTQYGGGISFIPTSDSSRFNLFLSGNYRSYSYREALTVNSNEFISESIDGIIALGYDISKTGYLRAGYTYKSTGYEIDDIEDRIESDIFTGVNYTLFGRNSFDFEFGYTMGNFNYYNAAHGALKSSDTVYNFLIDDKQNSTYLSLRYSRPLGKQSGISFNYMRRSNIDNIDTAVVLGYSSGYLDPWAAKNESNGIIVKHKSFAIPGMIITSGYGYWDKKYYPHVEEKYIVDMLGSNRVVSTIHKQDRTDITQRFFISALIPYVSNSGFKIEPQFNFELTKNSSSIKVYEYYDFTASLNIKLSY